MGSDAERLILRMLAQLLIKVHAGTDWGEGDAGVSALVKQALVLAEAEEKDDDGE